MLVNTRKGFPNLVTRRIRANAAPIASEYIQLLYKG